MRLLPTAAVTAALIALFAYSAAGQRAPPPRQAPHRPPCDDAPPLRAPVGEAVRPCHDVGPRLLNGARLRQLQDSLYTEELKDRGVGGVTVVSAFVDRTGTVRLACVANSSGYSRLDDIALAVTSRGRFSPARRDGEPVPTWTRRAWVFSFRILAPPEGLPEPTRAGPLPPCPRVERSG